MTNRLLIPCLLLMLVSGGLTRLSAADPTVYPMAVFPFQQRGVGNSDLGEQVTVLLTAELLEHPELYLVEREDLTKILDEQTLNVSGMVDPNSATKVGQLTGARILVAGSVLETNDKLYVVAKVIGTETSRVLGASVKGKMDGDLDDLAGNLAKKVARTVIDRGHELIADPPPRMDRIADLKKAVGNQRLPDLSIDVRERHVGQTTIDPAAETELTLYSTEVGFRVLEAREGKQNDADVLLIGEAISEYAARHGDLVSVKARLEVKAVDQESGQVIAIDREVAIGVDLTEQIAGKSALQHAAASIASRLLPKLVKPKHPNKKKKN
ncbi:Curli production assembly/transport component CsgG [Stieleria neptunia]|uniref:Curli production assembly/transport component CsgG n=1 Tax=Stieleria neptunia TaxID=2527979 RepID=A0A518HX23_9BACT|nr:CsgG/HfaB family protein [Stieleria neptunia]QDV45416.1 Curli production assembly/transport component CsgG [Stieleria neptunia]